MEPSLLQAEHPNSLSLSYGLSLIHVAAVSGVFSPISALLSLSLVSQALTSLFAGILLWLGANQNMHSSLIP